MFIWSGFRLLEWFNIRGRSKWNIRFFLLISSLFPRLIDWDFFFVGSNIKRKVNLIEIVDVYPYKYQIYYHKVKMGFYCNAVFQRIIWFDTSNTESWNRNLSFFSLQILKLARGARVSDLQLYQLQNLALCFIRSCFNITV